MVYLFPGQGMWTGGWRLGGILNARSGVPINVTIARPDNITVNGVTVTNIPGGNSRGTQRPDLVPGVDPYFEDGGIRWLNPAAFATPQPGTFGNLPRNLLRGPAFAQLDLMASKDFRFAKSQGLQFRVEMFNLLNHLNYENPAATLPNGAPGVPFSDAQAGTFGYMLGPLNRTVGLGYCPPDPDFAPISVLGGSFAAGGPRRPRQAAVGVILFEATDGCNWDVTEL